MPRPPRQCERCQTPLGPGSPFAIVEVSAIGGYAAPQGRRFLTCPGCASAVRNFLVAGPRPTESRPDPGPHNAPAPRPALPVGLPRPSIPDARPVRLASDASRFPPTARPPGQPP